MCRNTVINNEAMTCNKSTRKPHDTWLYSCNDTIINNEMTRSVSTAQEIWMTHWYSFIIIGERNWDGLLISGQYFISSIWESFLTITWRTKYGFEQIMANRYVHKYLKKSRWNSQALFPYFPIVRLPFEKYLRKNNKE